LGKPVWQACLRVVITRLKGIHLRLKTAYFIVKTT
jgi:hypothetical protein